LARTRKTATEIDSPYEATRYVAHPVQILLWARAAGRCEFSGCNSALWKSIVTQNEVNIGQKAHIRSFSPVGPRGRQDIDKSRLNSTENLMLVCHQCHRDIDSEEGEKKFTVEVLKAMKKRHEERMEVITGVSEDRSSHILLYGSNIGDQSPILSFSQAASAMLPERFPASSSSVLLQQSNVASTEVNTEFWASEETNLVRLFQRRVREPLIDGDLHHLSVFALAAQPLLVKLGTLLGDIAEVDVYQRHREPQTWRWPDDAEPLEIQIERPDEKNGEAALVIALSATVADRRIKDVLGEDVAIWRVTVPTPNNDLIKSRMHLTVLKQVLRQLFDEIKASHGQQSTLHIFPAAPVSACVEMGRVRMPKADMPWALYDHHNSRGGFQPTLSIN
jgi:hypothetical protein